MSDTTRRLNPDLSGAVVQTVAAEMRATVPVFTRQPSKDEQKLNKTERAYLLQLRQWGYEPGIQRITLKLADDCRFTPDFDYVDEHGRWVFVDVKGFQREDALIKAKVAARVYSQFRFQIVKRDGSGWEFIEVSP